VDIATKTTAGVAGLTTFASIVVPDTAGYRLRLLGFDLGPFDAAPDDKNVLWVVNRINDVSAGGAGSPADADVAPTPRRSDQAASYVLGQRDYTSGEPTTYMTEPWGYGGMNVRAMIPYRFAPGCAPYAGQDQALSLLVASTVASDAHDLCGSLIFEQDAN